MVAVIYQMAAIPATYDLIDESKLPYYERPPHVGHEIPQEQSTEDKSTALLEDLASIIRIQESQIWSSAFDAQIIGGKDSFSGCRACIADDSLLSW